MSRNQTLAPILLVAAATFCVWVFAASSGAQSRVSPQAGLTENLPNGPMHDKAVTACTECHEARIIVQQRLSKAAWTKEVDKMVKWGAVVDAADRDALIDYLSSNFGPDQPPYVAPRTSSGRTERRSQTSRPK